MPKAVADSPRRSRDPWGLFNELVGWRKEGVELRTGQEILKRAVAILFEHRNSAWASAEPTTRRCEPILIALTEIPQVCSSKLLTCEAGST